MLTMVSPTNIMKMEIHRVLGEAGISKLKAGQAGQVLQAG